jgi:hypothetical protein
MDHKRERGRRRRTSKTSRKKKDNPVRCAVCYECSGRRKREGRATVLSGDEGKCRKVKNSKKEGRKRRRRGPGSILLPLRQNSVRRSR